MQSRLISLLIAFLFFRANVTLCAAETTATNATTTVHRRPNLLLILTDDQRWDALGVVQREQGDKARFPWFTTPHLDRLASEGARFRNAFVVHSLCSPSRASFVSGQYGHRNGITNNVTDFPSTTVNQAALLQASGYRTAYIGKFHMGSQPARPGFGFVASYTGQGLYEGSTFLVNGKSQRPAGWVDDIATDYALEFIRTNQTQPWMMMLGYKAAHTPRTPPERARQRFADCSVKRAVNADAKPPYGRGQLALREDTPPPYKEAVTDAGGSDYYLINYFRSLSAMDDNIGRILAELDSLKLADDTLIVFAGDNGYFLGEHGLGDKRAAYDESMRIPLLLRYPRSGICGKLVDELVLNIDVAPTFLDFAGLPVPKAMQGASWKPVLDGKNTTWREAFLFSYAFESPLPATPAMLAVRTRTAKLITYPGHDAWTELFDLASDPCETRNLANDPAHATLLRRMRSEMATQISRFGNPLSVE